MSRLIDADALERDGWKMTRTVRVDKDTMEIQTRKPTDFSAIEDIKQAMHKVDMIRRPYIAFLHPDDAEAVKACLPRIEEEVIIQPTPYVEKGKGVCVKREDLESWATPHINDLF